MGVNKVEIMENGSARTLIDLTSDTVTAETLEEGITAHTKSGESIVGTGLPGRVRYDQSQTLTDAQKTQARTNIGAASSDDVTRLSTDVENVITTAEAAAANASSALSGLDDKAPTSHASTATTYGKATSSNYGHVKLSTSTSSTSGASGGIAATPSAVKAVKDLFGGKKIITGSSTISYGSTTTSVTVSFGYTYTAAPVVIVSQVFDDTNIIVKNGNITTTGFTATLAGAFSSSGARDFKWFAIG